MRSATEESNAERPRARGSKLGRIVIYGVIPAVLIGGTLSYLRLVKYVERDPGFCALCHQTRKEYTLWTQSEHRNIICQQCHHETRSEALAVLRKYVFEAGSASRKRPHKPLHKPLHNPKVGIGACEGCHMQHDQRWPQISGSIGHRVHVIEAKTSCLRCHARSIHRFSGTLEACGECHTEHVNKATGMERLHCLACHNFLDRGKTLKPGPSVCIDCHRSRGVFKTAFPKHAAMGQLECYSCHKPHAKGGPRDVSCKNCHDELSHYGLHSKEAHAKCLNCHVAHDWTARRQRCLTCHTEQAQHYSDRKECWTCHSFLRKGLRSGAMR